MEELFLIPPYNAVEIEMLRGILLYYLHRKISVATLKNIGGFHRKAGILEQRN